MNTIDRGWVSMCINPDCSIRGVANKIEPPVILDVVITGKIEPPVILDVVITGKIEV